MLRTWMAQQREWDRRGQLPPNQNHVKKKRCSALARRNPSTTILPPRSDCLPLVARREHENGISFKDVVIVRRRQLLHYLACLFTAVVFGSVIYKEREVRCGFNQVQLIVKYIPLCILHNNLLSSCPIHILKSIFCYLLPSLCITTMGFCTMYTTLDL